MKKRIFVIFLFLLFYIKPINAMPMYEGETVELTITVQESGVYNLLLEYIPISAFLNPEFSLKINNEPIADRIIAPIIWQPGADTFTRNESGHEQLPRPVHADGTQSTLLYYADFLGIIPISVYLNEGENIIILQNISGEMTIVDLKAQIPRVIPTYNEYTHVHRNEPHPTAHIRQEAQHPTFFNTSFIRPLAIQNPDLSPYSSRYLLLNAFGGGEWSEQGQSVTYSIYVPATGMYNLTLRVQQSISGAVVFRNIKINGKIPFQEVIAYPVPHYRNFTSHTLPFYFFFEEGLNTITLTATSAPVETMVESLAHVREEIGQLAMTIRRLTGGVIDRNRDWQLENYIPNVREMFDSWINEISRVYEQIEFLYDNPTPAAVQVDMNHIMRRLRVLGDNPHELPFRMSELFDGMSSAGMMLANVESALEHNPLTLESIHIHSSDAELPKRASIFQRIRSFFEQFFASFTMQVNRDTSESLEVWVARSQWHVELLQHLVDTQFTPYSNIHVNISLIPDDNNIILANAGGRSPDAALGVSMHLPFQLAIRGASVDLTQFDNFSNIAERFSPGAFLPMMYDGGVFGLPETQDFNVLFYRRDILETFGIEVPNTWDDVIGILPELSRFGANFFAPLSGSGGHKPFSVTAPFIYQFGGDLYSITGLSTAINSEAGINALNFMTDLFTIYSVPLQVANFYNDFRNGNIPIGISGLGTYVTLTNAAPEIRGMWDIAPHPGMYDEHGNIQRWATGSAQSAMILSQSSRQEDAFIFLDWWTSTEAQTMYAHNLMTIHGPAWLWSSANLQAFNNLPIPRHHRDVILYQWQYLKEVPLMPASYIIEREISNIWNRVVFDGENLRIATDRAVTIINREMRRRMEHFGYFNQTEMIRYYNIPTMEQARGLVHD